MSTRNLSTRTSTLVGIGTRWGLGHACCASAFPAGSQLYMYTNNEPVSRCSQAILASIMPGVFRHGSGGEPRIEHPVVLHEALSTMRFDQMTKAEEVTERRWTASAVHSPLEVASQFLSTSEGFRYQNPSPREATGDDPH